MPEATDAQLEGWITDLPQLAAFMRLGEMIQAMHPEWSAERCAAETKAMVERCARTGLAIPPADNDD